MGPKFEDPDPRETGHCATDGPGISIVTRAEFDHRIISARCETAAPRQILDREYFLTAFSELYSMHPTCST